MKPLLTILLVLIPFILIGQAKSKLLLDLENGIESYKHRCIEKCTNYEELITKIQRWHEIEKDSFIVKDILFQSVYAQNITKIKPTRILSIIKEEYPNSQLKNIIQIEDLLLLKDCSSFMELISSGTIKINPPHKIDLQKGFLDWLEFCELEDAKTIIEIGAGTGIFSHLITIAYPNSELIINEINQDLLTHISEKLGELENVSFVKGSKTKTQIKKQADKIIITNSLHHFKKKDKMLKSIKENLKPNGELILIETLKENNSNYGCDLKMDKESLLNLLKTNDYQLVKSQIKEPDLYLKYKKIESH